MTTVRQPTKCQRSCVLNLKYTFICVYWWTRQRIHNTLIVVDRYLRLMGDKTIPDEAEPQGVVDSYNLYNRSLYTGKPTSSGFAEVCKIPRHINNKYNSNLNASVQLSKGPIHHYILFESLMVDTKCISNYIHYKVQEKLLIPSQTPTMQLLKFGNG